MAIDDQGNAFSLSPDPLLDTVTPYVAGLSLGAVKDAAQAEAALKPLLEREDIFGVNLYSCGMAKKVLGFFVEMTEGPGSVARVLEKYISLT